MKRFTVQPACEPSRSAYWIEEVPVGNWMQELTSPVPGMLIDGLMRFALSHVVSPFPYSLKRNIGPWAAAIEARPAKMKVVYCMLYSVDCFGGGFCLRRIERTSLIEVRINTHSGEVEDHTSSSKVDTIAKAYTSAECYVRRR